MNATKTDLLPVPGASLYYEVRGSGPVLLISQSGEGDAGTQPPIWSTSSSIGTRW